MGVGVAVGPLENIEFCPPIPGRQFVSACRLTVCRENQLQAWRDVEKICTWAQLELETL